jgi:hypothetical protein
MTQIKETQPNELFDKFRKSTIEAVTSGKMSREGYLKFWDEFNQKHPDFCKKNFYRRDFRSLGQFALDLYENAADEANNFDKWFHTHGSKYFKSKKYENFGAEASGMLLYKEDNQRGNPDFILSDGTKIEYKLNYATCRKGTYKVADLRSYLEHGCYVLTEFIIKDHNYGYVLMSPDEIKRIMDAVKEQKIEVFNFRGMGYKPAVQFYIKTKAGTEQQSVPLTEYCKHIHL